MFAKAALAPVKPAKPPNFKGARGTATGGLVCLGNNGSRPYRTNATEEYDGNGWSAG